MEITNCPFCNECLQQANEFSIYDRCKNSNCKHYFFSPRHPSMAISTPITFNIRNKNYAWYTDKISIFTIFDKSNLKFDKAIKMERKDFLYLLNDVDKFLKILEKLADLE